jgi:hypothetical protein
MEHHLPVPRALSTIMVAIGSAAQPLPININE